MTDWISREDRVALASLDGILVHRVRRVGGMSVVFVTGPGEARVRERVAMRLGPGCEVRYCGETPREVRPAPCVGYAETDPGLLELRLRLRFQQQVAEVFVTEDHDTVVVAAFACVSVTGDAGDPAERRVPAYLGEPLAGRAVIDGFGRGRVPALSAA